MKIIGRKNEIELLERYSQSKESEFVAVYGRRRVGKTYLVNEVFHEDFAFSVTALNDNHKAIQLKNFHTALHNFGSKAAAPATDWYDAFEQLIALLEGSRKKGKKIIFLDQLLASAGLKSGGAVTAILTELEQCGFIERYNDFSGKHGRHIYQLTDFFVLFISST